MFWSKTWFLLVALVGALAVAVALSGGAAARSATSSRRPGARLERAQHSASLLLKVNARKWIDTAAQVATDAVLVESLEQATKGPGRSRPRAQDGSGAAALLQRQDEGGPGLGDGRARTGDRARRPRRAGLQGRRSRAFRSSPTRCAAIAATTPGRSSGKLYRVAASPVIARDHYAGSLVVGQEVAGELAQSMKRVLNVDVAFLLRGRVLAPRRSCRCWRSCRSSSTSTSTEMAAQRAHRSRSTIEQGGEGFLVVAAPFAGEAEDHKAAYALIVPTAAAGDVRYLAVAAAGDGSEDAAVDAAGADRRRPAAGAHHRLRARCGSRRSGRSSGWRASRSRWRAATSRGSTTTGIRGASARWRARSTRRSTGSARRRG